MTADLANPAPLPYKNRRGWLIAFGVFEIAIAFISLMMVLLLILVFTLPQFRTASSSPQNQAPQAAAVIPGVIVYGGMAAVFLILGVGSIRCRNWARIGMIVVSGFWLGTGALTTLVIALMLPAIIRQQGAQNPDVGRVVFLVMMVFMVLFMILTPAIFLIFYRRKSVKATCLAQAAGPAPPAISIEADSAGGKPKATAPVPVIILAIWQGFGVFAPVTLLMVKSTIFFGIFLHGPPAILYLSIYSFLCGFASWSIFRQKLMGWEICLFVALFGMASFVTTFAGRDPLQIYREMGLAEEQLRIFNEFPQMTWITLIMGLLSFTGYFAFLVYTRKFFSAQPRPRSGLAP